MNDAATLSARAVLEAAAELEAAESVIRCAIRRAADRGDTAAVISIMDRWEHRPATEVAAELSGERAPGSMA
jgi:hypothetical protein